MTVELIALDLDGTLMGEAQVISQRSRRAVERAIDQGCRVTIATGRGFPPAARFGRALEVNAPLICYQGALIRDYRDGTIVHTVTIPLNVAREVIAFSQARQLNLQVYMEDGRAYADRVNPAITRFADVSGVPVTSVGDLAGWLRHPPLKFLFVERKEAIPELVRALHTQFDGQLQAMQSWEWLVEVTAPEASKGEALRRLAAHLEVPQPATMAIGDQDNDVSMIAWAGLGVAMGDGSPAARDAADVIAPPLADDGAAWAIERYVLGE
jgi:Cof subfamily protein (haloacid dehalogenase superfamily)